MSMMKNILSGGFLALSCISFWGGAAQAEQTERVTYDRALVTKLPSTNDDIGIAFFKTSGNFPDFTKIVQDSDAFKKLNPLAQQDYETKVVAKMQTDYAAFSPKKSDIIIRAKVNVLFNKLPNGEGTMKLVTFPNDPIYFPFYFAKYPIALIVKDMENFRDIHLNQEETDMVYRRLQLGGDATMLLQLYAVAANAQKPIMLDNIPQYPFLAEIGYIGLLNNRAEQIWAWRNEKVTGKPSIGGSARDIRNLVNKP